MVKMNGEIIVVKFGSKSLTGDPADAEVLGKNIELYSLDLAKYKGRLVVVSSGAVFCGGLLEPKLKDKSVLATIGNPFLFRIWQEAFLELNTIASQILVTHRELEIKEERLRLREVIDSSIRSDVVPIFNENDALSDEELKRLVYGGDNDGFAREIAEISGATKLILFTNEEGFIVNGKLKANLSLSRARELIDHAKGSDRGGGMVTKLNSAIDFVASGSNRSAYIARAGEGVESVIAGLKGTKISSAE
jgi:glutamate 5-kinase